MRTAKKYGQYQYYPSPLELSSPRPSATSAFTSRVHYVLTGAILLPQGKAYSEDQRLRVKGLLEQGRDEESIEKETGVSDRTIRRWKLELERTGRIGKVCATFMVCVRQCLRITANCTLRSRQKVGRVGTGF